MEDWQQRFGRIYRSLIDAGVLSVMSAHIALPSWARQVGIKDEIDAYMPASVSKALNTHLLRNQLGFNGLIVSDATVMGGFTSWADRATMVPQAIESGCDIFLMARDEAVDINSMLLGLKEGRLSEQRLEDAVTRVLGLKAALGLHRQSIDERLPPLERARATLRRPEHEALATEASARSVTLVKNRDETLPISPGLHRRIVVVSQSGHSRVPGIEEASLQPLLDGLRARGFDVRAFDSGKLPTRHDTDLLLYVLTQESMLTVSRIFTDWSALQPGLLQSMDRFWHDIPTVMVSFGHPYYLYDAPRVPAYVNAYSAIAPVQRAVVERLVGEKPFEGKNPVDPFCGLPDARF